MDDRERNPDHRGPGYASRDASSREPKPGEAPAVSELQRPGQEAPSGHGGSGDAGAAPAGVQGAQHGPRAADVVYLRDRRARRGHVVQRGQRVTQMRSTPRRQGFEPWYWYVGSHSQTGLSAPAGPQRISGTGSLEHSAWGDNARGADELRSSSWLYAVLSMIERLVRKLQGTPHPHVGPTSPDECIRWEVNKRLAQQGSLDPSGIDVEVSNGEVTLCGVAESRHDKYVAEEIADDVSGVIDVHNHLSVREGSGVLPFTKSGGANGEPHKSGPKSTRKARR